MSPRMGGLSCWLGLAYHSNLSSCRTGFRQPIKRGLLHSRLHVPTLSFWFLWS